MEESVVPNDDERQFLYQYDFLVWETHHLQTVSEPKLP